VRLDVSTGEAGTIIKANPVTTACPILADDAVVRLIMHIGEMRLTTAEAEGGSLTWKLCSGSSVVILHWMAKPWVLMLS
jgi:hypothetical protein